jgi:hypothetical protein
MLWFCIVLAWAQGKDTKKVEICKKISRKCKVSFIIYRFPFPDESRRTTSCPPVAVLNHMPFRSERLLLKQVSNWPFAPMQDTRGVEWGAPNKSLILQQWSRACQLQHATTSTMALRMRISFNSKLFSTINPHHHVKYSWLNYNVKRMVEIDPSVEKIDWFADLVLALTTTRVQMQPIYFIFLISWSPWVSFIYLHLRFRKIQRKTLFERLTIDLILWLSKRQAAGANFLSLYANLYCWPLIVTSPCKTCNNQS